VAPTAGDAGGEQPGIVVGADRFKKIGYPQGGLHRLPVEPEKLARHLLPA
jgi:hypothetical protein